MVETMQKSLFGTSFMEMLDSNDLLIVLADNFPWSKIKLKLSKYYNGIRRPPLPIRLMIRSIL